MSDGSQQNSPQPFRRERNLSNRNFRKSGSRRRISTESQNSIQDTTDSSISTSTKSLSLNTSANNNSHSNSHSSNSSGSAILNSTSSSSLQFSYSVNSDTENAFNQKSMRKMIPLQNTDNTNNVVVDDDNEVPQTPDPALMGVRQKVLRFETLQSDESIIFKTGKFNSRSMPTLNNNTTSMMNNVSGGHPTPLRLLPIFGGDGTSPQSPRSQFVSARSSIVSSPFHTSIDEERSEDDVDDFSDYEDAEPPQAQSTQVYVVPEVAEEVGENFKSHQGEELVAGNTTISGIVFNKVPELTFDDFSKVETVKHSTSQNGSTPTSPTSPTSQTVGSGDLVTILSHSNNQLGVAKKGATDFPRNYRSTPRPKTEIIGTKNQQVARKYNSVYSPNDDEQDDVESKEHEDDEIELRAKCDKYVHNELEELIATEETYVQNLLLGIANYGDIFKRKDLPAGLRGKKYVLLGNIEQIAEFHRDEFLPMLQRNRRDLKLLFEEFQIFLDQNCFYGYVIFTMNKQRSLKLCDVYKNYFKLIQTEIDDKLGINSFLVQPIQRMARYPLLLSEFIKKLFKNRDFIMKPVIESCCRLEKKMRTLLITTNESEIINDIIECHEFNVFFQGKFRKVSEFHVFDHTLKRTYRSKVFIFDKCIIYTEIKGKSLIFRGRYPCEHIGIQSKTKTFTLFYERRKQLECDFHGDPGLIEIWLELIRDMVNSYVTEERQKLKERYSNENDHLYLQRKTPSLSLYRDSNRFSTDSGIGNIWVMPKPEYDENAANKRTTWYTPD